MLTVAANTSFELYCGLYAFGNGTRDYYLLYLTYYKYSYIGEIPPSNIITVSDSIVSGNHTITTGVVGL